MIPRLRGGTSVNLPIRSLCRSDRSPEIASSQRCGGAGGILVLIAGVPVTSELDFVLVIEMEACLKRDPEVLIFDLTSR